MQLSPTMVPVRLALDRAAVEVVEMVGEDFRAPFLEHTDFEHRHRDPPSARGWAPLEDYLAAAEPEGRDPQGLIFGVGRSGSTLLCNLLGEVDSLLVMKEAQPVGEMVHACVRNAAGRAGDPHTERDAAALADLLARVVRSLFRPTRGQQELVVKESWLGSANCAYLTDAFPAAPVVFVTRAADEVVASFLDHPPPWAGDLLHRPAADLAVMLPSLGETPEAYLDAPTLYTHFWLSATLAVRAIDPVRVLILTQEELAADPADALHRVLGHLGLDASAREVDAARERSRYYAKPDPGEPPRLLTESAERGVDLDASVRRRVADIITAGLA